MARDNLALFCFSAAWVWGSLGKSYYATSQKNIKVYASKKIK